MTFLRFPTKFNNNLPVVTFTPFDYTAAIPSTEQQNLTGNKTRNEKVPVVSLYMPGDFSETLNASWSEEEILQGSGGSVWANISNNLLTSLAGKDSKLVNSAAAFAGRAPVPMDMLLFKSVSPMSIQFNFKMVPFDKEEGDNMIQICNTFKRYIMPSLDADTKNVLMKFPVLWDISLTGMNGVGFGFDNETGLPKTGYELMALTSCNVNYTSSIEGAAVYEDHNPVQVNLQLGFQHIKKHYTT